MSFPLPRYIEALPEEEQGPARAKFLVRLTALYHNESGVITRLAEGMGLHERTLHSILQSPTLKISPQMAVKLEKAVGRDKLPRELFRPDIFVVEEEL